MKIKAYLMDISEYLIVHGSFCFQVKQVCDAQPFVEQIRAWFFSNTESNLTWHLAKCYVHSSSSSSTEKQIKGLEFAITHDWVKAFYIGAGFLQARDVFQ